MASPSLLLTPAPSSPRLSPLLICPAKYHLTIRSHAGYTYSGPAAAYAYASLSLSNIKRVFILGPSHHHYFTSLSLSRYTHYSTPLGNLEIDVDICRELAEQTGMGYMSPSVDDDEHSIEMHLPYVYKMLSLTGITPMPKIVPILVGAINAKQEREWGEKLRPYVLDNQNAFVVSSDFCHWFVPILV